MGRGPGTGDRAGGRRLRPGPGGAPALDRLAELAARLLGAPSSQVSLVTGVQTVAGGAGLPAGAIGGKTPLAEALCAMTASSGAPLLVPDAAADPRVADLPSVVAGTVGSYLGVPLTADDGRTVGALCVFGPAPRSWAAADVALLEQVAASVVAELQLSVLTAHYEVGQVVKELALEAADIGTFDWDLATDELAWDARLADLFGFAAAPPPAPSFAALRARLHPDDEPRVMSAVRFSVETCDGLVTEFRTVLPDGGSRWVAIRGRALGEDGRATRLLGAAYDTSAVREGDARFARVLESMSAAFMSLDRDWRFTYVNAEAERLVGRPRQELLGGVLWELFPATIGAEFEVHYRRAVDTQRPVTFEAHYPAPLDARYEVRAWPTPEGLSVYFLDVTARHAAQQEAARAARRAALLSEVSAALTETLDPEEAVARLARLVAPTLVDGCIVTLVEDDHGDWRRQLRATGSWHGDAALRPVLERYCAVRARALTERSSVAEVMRTGRPAVVASGAAALTEQVLAAGEARELRRAIAPESIAVLPLRGRGRTVGLLTAFDGADRGPVGPEELATLGEVAARAGLALDNVRLYAQQRQLAEGLQRSLLTDPPEPDHLQLAVRYTPAAEAAQVGGDWYDAFLQRSGDTVLVIGDVVGHDTAAAAAMGQVRGLLRGIAVHSGNGPAQVLRGVDEVLETLQLGTTATAVVARLEQTREERARGITRLRWSNAGHPPPVVVTAGGAVTQLTGEGSNLLLGIDPRARRTEQEAVLELRSTVLLYTDGLVERRGQSLQVGLARLQEVLGDLAAARLPLEELCDELLARLVPARPDDDVALVAVRLHPQDRPRPAEAGPRRIPATVEDQPEAVPQDVPPDP